MNKPEGYAGTLSITWEDGEKNTFQVVQSKGFIWIGDHMVSPRNEKSIQGVISEISEVFSNPQRKVRQYTWTELVKPLHFPKP